MNQYAERDIQALDKDGGHYCRHVQAIAAEWLFLKSDIAAELAWRDAEIERLKSQFTKLDSPKYKGEPMLDDVLKERNADFDAWVKTMPPQYWARYDLSAARIGFEAGSESQGDARRFRWMHSGKQTESDALCRCEMRALSEDYPTLDEWRMAVDLCMEHEKPPNAAVQRHLRRGTLLRKQKWATGQMSDATAC